MARPPATDLAAGATQLVIPTQAPVPPSPISQFRLSAEQDKFVYETWQLGMQRCMAKVGFDYVPISYDVVHTDVTTPSAEDSVTRYGYDLPPGADAIVISVNDKQVQANDAYRRAFLGDDPDRPGGCRESTFQAVYDPSGAFATLDQQVASAIVDISVAVESDPAMLALNAAWSTCMQQRGFAYDDPSDPLSEFAGGGLQSDEVATRVADLVCQAEVSYLQTVGQLQNMATTRWMDDHSQLVEDLATARDSYIRSLQAYRAQLEAA